MLSPLFSRAGLSDRGFTGKALSSARTPSADKQAQARDTWSEAEALRLHLPKAIFLPVAERQFLSVNCDSGVSMSEKQDNRLSTNDTVLSDGAGMKIGRYTVTRRIGRGSMGEVWLGEDPESSTRVAIKAIPV